MNVELWNKLEHFPLDCPGASFRFSDRLARENNWSDEYTSRVIFEYRRFLYLSREAGHSISPPDAVDQVWHLHLCYTESYWKDLCRDTLGFKFHHGPTRGGQDEREKYGDWYRQTKESYEKLFGEAAPADIWPDDSLRFGKQDFRRVDVSEHFVIAKKTVVLSGVGGALAVVLAGCSPYLALVETFPWEIVLIVGFIVVVLVISIAKGGRGGPGGGGCAGGSNGCGGDSGCGGGCGGD